MNAPARMATAFRITEDNIEHKMAVVDFGSTRAKTMRSWRRPPRFADSIAFLESPVDADVTELTLQKVAT